jgi:hypothetical protein
MMPFVIVSMALAAPIPKSTYEGTIALLITKPKKEILLLSPNGAELKRIDLSGVTGQPTLIKLAKANNGALVQTFELINQANQQYVNRSYLVDLKTSDKPKQVFQTDHPYSSTVDRDATFVYISENDSDIKQQNLQSPTFRHWKVDLKTGKKSKLDLPGNHEIKDCAHEEQCLLTSHWPDQQQQNTRAAKISLETYVVKYVSDFRISASAISPDGRSLVTFEVGRNQFPGRPTINYIFRNTKDGSKTASFDAGDIRELGAYACGPISRFAVLRYSRDARTNELQYSLYVYPPDGKSSKIIFETKPGLSIVDMEWR